jgi:V/A-type H+-transporting ATPase subunit E
MGLDTIVNDILEKARAESEAILKDAQAEADRIIADAKAEAEAFREEREEAVRREVERLRRQEISGANLEVKRAILNARKDLLDEVYRRAEERLQNLPVDRQSSILETIIRKHASDGDRIYSNERDKLLITSISNHEYAGTIDCIGGVVIESSDGDTRLDYTYDTLLKEVNEASLKQISEILFG